MLMRLKRCIAVSGIIAAALFLPHNANADSIDDIVAKSSAYPVFIEKKYAAKVADATTVINGKMGSVIQKIQAYDFRDLHLTSTYEAVISFAKEQSLRCKYGKENFYTVNQLMGIDQVEGYNLETEADRDMISQSLIYCGENKMGDAFDPKLPARFSFTPLGRLFAISMTIQSDEAHESALKTFEEKFSGKEWKFNCFDGSSANCRRGKKYYGDDMIELAIEYNENFKEFKDGQYQYYYTVNISSGILADMDALSLRVALKEKVGQKPKTKF